MICAKRLWSFWCFQLHTDNITCGDPPDRVWETDSCNSIYANVSQAKFTCSDYPCTRSLIKPAACSVHWLKEHVSKWPLSLVTVFFSSLNAVSDFFSLAFGHFPICERFLIKNWLCFLISPDPKFRVSYWWLKKWDALISIWTYDLQRF